MRTAFLRRDDEVGCISARYELRDRFAQQWQATSPELVDHLLRHKHFRDGLLARWTADDLHDAVLAIARLSASEAPQDLRETLRHWIDFLQEQNLLMSPEPRTELHAAIDAAATALAAGNLPFDHEPTFYAEWLPPMRVRDETAALAEGASTEGVERMRDLLTWLGTGRALAEFRDGSAEAEIGGTANDVILILHWAAAGELVEFEDDTVHRTETGTSLLRDKESLWERMWDTVVPALTESVSENDIPRAAARTPATDDEIVETVVETTLRHTYQHTDPVPFEWLVDTIAQRLHDQAAESDPVSESVRARVHVLLHFLHRALGMIGLVRTYSTTDPQQTERIRRAFPAGTDPDLTMVELLPVGVWAARHALARAGFVAPTVEEVAALPAEVMVLTVPNSPDDVVEDVIETWIEHRGARAACRELTELLGRVDDPVVRMLTLHALERTGRDGVEAAQELTDDPLAGPALRLWLQGRPGADSVRLHEDDELRMSLDAMALSAFADVGELLALFAQWSPDEQQQVLDQIRTSGHTGSADILRTLAGHSTEPELARAANDALRTLT